MKKEQFLNTLKRKLRILTSEEVDKVLKQYSDKIDKKIESGKSEEEVIKEFGPIDELVKKILAKYKISDQYNKETSRIDYYIDWVVDKIIAFFHEFSNLLATKKGENIIRIVFKVFIILLFIWLLKLPFYIIDGFGKVILHIFPYTIYSFLIGLWSALIHFAYIISAVVLLYILMKRLITEEKDNKQVINENKSEEKIIEAPKKKTSRKKEEKKENYAAMMFQPFLIIIKTIVILITLPIWCLVIFLSVILGLLVCMLFQGVYLLSPFFIIIGLLLISSSLLGLIYYFAFRKEENR